MAWIPFKGRALRMRSSWLLNPIEDKNVQIELAAEDVQVEAAQVSVREGARAQSILIPENSPLNLDPQRLSKVTCAGGKSRCAGGVEWCCNDAVAGGCHGRWNDCGSDAKLKTVGASELPQYVGAGGYEKA